METEGVTSNKLGTDTVIAVSYGLANAKTDDVYVQNQNDYKVPMFVDKLPMRQPIDGGNPELIDEVSLIFLLT